MANRDNPRLGAEFESAVRELFKRQGINLEKDFTINLGAASLKRPRKFDLGSRSPPIIVECKRHRWTEGANAPSAKLSVWNEAMYYFALAPPKYQKILMVLMSRRRGETLAEYYLSRFEHLVPRGVEIWQYDPDDNLADRVY